MLGLLGMHPFSAIAPRTTLAGNGSTWLRPISGSSRTNCILMLNWIVWIRTLWLNWIAWNRNVLECSPMARETRVQSQVKLYQILKKWYLIPPCLTLSIIRYVSRVKWSNPGKGVAPSPTPRWSSHWKGIFRVALEYYRQLTYLQYLNWIFLNGTFFCFWHWNFTYAKLNCLI